jgi:hypothetical protein
MIDLFEERRTMERTSLSALVVTTALSIASLGHAVAAPFYASYETSSGDVVAFIVDGTVQAGTDVVVGGAMLTTPTFNGVASPVTGAVLQSWSNFLFSDGKSPTLSFSGSTMNFLWGNTPFTEGFLFDDGTLGANVAPFYAGGPSFGNTFEPFVAANWSLAPAFTFDANYETSAGDHLGFSFWGTIGADNDTVGVITLLADPVFNGVASPVTGAVLQSWSNFLFSDGKSPTLSFSGSTMNFLWGNAPFTEGFLFDDGTLGANVAPFYAGGPSFGNTFEPFVAANWSLARQHAVPEPSMAALILIGLCAVGLGPLRRRRE